MGTLLTNTCIITGLPVIQNLITDQLGYDYKINAMGHEQIISLPADFEIDYSEYLDQYDYILKGLLYNGIWTKSIEQLNENMLNTLISENTFPKTPQEKIDALFEFIFRMQNFDGEEILFRDTGFLNDFGSWNKLYFKNLSEVYFYLKELGTLGLAKIRLNADSYPISIQLTLGGLNYVNRLIEGKESNTCFVAMSFDISLNYIYYDAIKSAIEQTGFIPLIIRDENLPSDVTINDGIISNIKKSSFIIADFTQNKKGVYFEAGYALGRGLKVIYTCKNEPAETNELHFDTNHYQHILWDDAEDLKIKLINKIEAFIKP
jgi:hypothetical protein